MIVRTASAALLVAVGAGALGAVIADALGRAAVRFVREVIA